MGLLFGSAGAHTYLKSGQVAPPPLDPKIWNQLNIIPYWLLKEIVEFLNKRLFMPIGIGKR